jgi:tRNA threonylcarbamoyl adenosine modification protein YeaZ
MPLEQQNIIYFDLSMPHGVIGILEDHEVVVEYILSERLKNAETISLFFRQLLVSRPEINAIVVSIGPGSFIGTRVALALAKGFCFGAEVNLYALSSLHWLSQAGQPATAKNMTLIDARKNQFYALSCSPEEQLSLLDDELLRHHDDLEQYIVCCPQSELHVRIPNSWHNKLSIHEHLSGSMLLRLIREKPSYLVLQTEFAKNTVPLYLREPSIHKQTNNKPL